MRRVIWVSSVNLDRDDMHLYGFHVRWNFLPTSLRKFGDKWWEIHLVWKTIQNAFSRILCTSMHFNHAKYTAQSWIPWMYLSHYCSLHGGSMREMADWSRGANDRINCQKRTEVKMGNERPSQYDRGRESLKQGVLTRHTEPTISSHHITSVCPVCKCFCLILFLTDMDGSFISAVCMHYVSY